MSGLLIYGSTGYVGAVMAERAAGQGLEPVIAGRTAPRVQEQGRHLGLDSQAFALDDPLTMDRALAEATVVLNCAGPFHQTAEPLIEACLRTRTHYLDITGEIGVLEAVAQRDRRAKQAGVMLLPAAGFDVVPTDCLALHLHRRLPSATHLSIAFRSRGRAGAPPGTQRTAIDIIPDGIRFRRDGRLVTSRRGRVTRKVDFGDGPREVARFTWGDVFTAYFTTGIPNIESYLALPRRAQRMLAVAYPVRSALRLPFVRRFLRGRVAPGPSGEARARTSTDVWAQVEDGNGRTATARLNGPEAGVEWTVGAALATARKALEGETKPGFQTPAGAYGPDFVFEGVDVRREDLD